MIEGQRADIVNSEHRCVGGGGAPRYLRPLGV